MMWFVLPLLCTTATGLCRRRGAVTYCEESLSLKDISNSTRALVLANVPVVDCYSAVELKMRAPGLTHITVLASSQTLCPCLGSEGIPCGVAISGCYNAKASASLCTTTTLHSGSKITVKMDEDVTIAISVGGTLGGSGIAIGLAIVIVYYRKRNVRNNAPNITGRTMIMESVNATQAQVDQAEEIAADVSTDDISWDAPPASSTPMKKEES